MTDAPTQARMVRDALKAVAAETTSGRTMSAALQLAVADDETLCRFRRLVK